MVNRQKQKGTRREYEMRDWFKELGLRCKRVILSGALGGALSGDLHLFLPKQRKPIKIEVVGDFHPRGGIKTIINTNSDK